VNAGMYLDDYQLTGGMVRGAASSGHWAALAAL
jgi:hypothetical protein